MENINITIQQAYYGEVNRSHGCLATTIEDSGLRSFLTAFTDRPGSLTAGTPLSAYYSGMSHGESYILTRTIADGTASRGGMVFTHALIIRSADLNSINDLSKLFLYFATEKPAASFSLAPLMISGAELAEKSVHVPPCTYLRKVVSGLIANEGPVLFCGELASFENVLSTIWCGLPSSFRKGLSFTTAFSVNALDAGKKLIYVQKELLPVFRNSGPVTDDEVTAPTELSEVEKFILSQEGENEFDAFIRSLEVNLNDWAILTPCVRAFHLYVKISRAITADELRLLIRNIAKISPGPGTGTTIKTAAIAKLSQLISAGTDTNLKAMRNLGLQEFAGGTEILSNAIQELLAGMFAKTIPMAADVVNELFLTVQPTTVTTWWQRAVAAALSAAGRSKKPKPVEIFWSLLNRADGPAAAILSYIDNSTETEEIFIENLPGTVNAHASAIIAKLIQPRKWFLLHAQLIKPYGEYKEAVIEQFNYESAYQASSFPGTRYLLPELKDNDLLAVCFEKGNQMFFKAYAERAVKKPALLGTINLNKPVWLAIWSVSLDTTKDLSHGITDLGKVVLGVFDLLLKDSSIPNNILTLIAASRYADLTEHDQRALLWRKLPASLTAKFLTATTEGFVAQVIGGMIMAPPENELTQTIGQDAFMTKFLSDQRTDIAAVLNLYDVVPGLKDKFLADYVGYFHGNLTDLLSLRLGELVLAKNFRITARQIFEKAKYQHTFKVALQKCKSLITLGFWDKLFHGTILGETISEAAVYEELLGTAIKHYDKGPEDKDIWKRAGGDNGKLSNNRTREESWRDAISLLQRGGGGKHLSVQGLIKEMEEDFPQSNELRELKKYFKHK